MAQQGYYPDPPSRRMAFDEDGTNVLLVATNLTAYEELSFTKKRSLNDESSSYIESSATSYHQYLTFIFPEKRTITHFFGSATTSGGPGSFWDAFGGRIQWSNNTNTGMDGNWTTVANSWDNNAASANTIWGAPFFRENLQTFLIQDVKAVRFELVKEEVGYYTPRWFAFHLWGYKSAGETQHRIDFTDIDGSELIQDFDYGDQPRNTSRIWTPTTTYNQGSGLYLRNRSTEKVANDVNLQFQAPSGPMLPLLSISKDNVTFGTQIAYASIQPQQIVGPVYLKHSPGPTATLGMATARIKLTVGSWL